jgi:hypothetical protein
MMQVNDDYFEQLTQEKVNRILDDLKREGKSPLASGPFMFPPTLALPLEGGGMGGGGQHSGKSKSP